MRVQGMISAALSLAAVSQAAALVAREAPSVQSVLCVSPGEKNCGLFVEYTNGARSESVQTESGGLTGCAYDLYRKHTNGDGFWADVNIFHDAGLNIGYNPTGRSLTLGAATSSVPETGFLAYQCREIFGFDDIDPSLSSWDVWTGFDSQLY